MVLIIKPEVKLGILLLTIAAFVLTFVMSSLRTFDNLSTGYLTSENSIIALFSVVSVLGLITVFGVYLRAIKGSPSYKRVELRQRLRAETKKDEVFKQFPEAEPDRRIARARSTELMEPAFVDMIQTRVKAVAGK